MKKECDIVQDLLFGYADNTLKQGSKELVEEHLKTCEKCKNILEDIKNDDNNDVEKIDGLKKVNKSLRNKKIAIIVMFPIILVFIIYSFWASCEYVNYMKSMEIYFDTSATNEQINDVKKMIYEIDEEAKIVYKSSNEALEEMRENLPADSSYILDGYENSNIFPASFLVKTKKNKREEIKNKLEDCTYIKSVNIVNYNYMEIYALYFLEMIN